MIYPNNLESKIKTFKKFDDKKNNYYLICLFLV